MIAGELESTKIEEPGGDDRSPPPGLGNVRQVEREPLIRRELFGGPSLEEIEALRISLHQAIFDPIVHHLDEMARTGRAGMDVALLGPIVATDPGRC